MKSKTVTLGINCVYGNENALDITLSYRGHQIKNWVIHRGGELLYVVNAKIWARNQKFTHYKSNAFRRKPL